MSQHVELQRIDEVSDDLDVAHYDELGPLAKDQLFKLVEGDTTSIRDEAAEEFRNQEIVKFTDYYKIQVH